MRAEILIQLGQAKLLNPLYLKPDAPTHYHIEVPDDALLYARDYLEEQSRPADVGKVPAARPGSLQERLNQLLGPLAKIRPSASIGDDYQTVQDALEERYFGR
ncbi:MAG: hypothetical protein WBJ68_02330 [Candidatus Dechloromonas phosphoritropha]